MMIIRPEFLATLSGDEMHAYLATHAIPARFMLAATVQICTEGDDMFGMFGRIEHVIPASGEDCETFIIDLFGTGEHVCRAAHSFSLARPNYFLDT